MPATSVTQVRDEAYAMFFAPWKLSPYYSGAGEVKLHFVDVENDFKEPEGSFIRVNLVHTNENPRTLNEAGSRKYRAFAIINFQVFTPPGEGQRLADELCEFLMACYRGKKSPNDILHVRNVYMNEAGIDRGHLQTNVTVNFDYERYA